MDLCKSFLHWSCWKVSAVAYGIHTLKHITYSWEKMGFSSESLSLPKLFPITASCEMAESFLPGSSLMKECSFRDKSGVRKTDSNPCLSLLFSYFLFRLCKLQGVLMQMASTCYSLYLRIVRLKNPVLPAIWLRMRDRKNKEILSGWYFAYPGCYFPHLDIRQLDSLISDKC